MMELAVLEKNPESAGPISPSLDEYLTYVAKSGNALFEWNKIKPLFKKKLQIVIQEFHDSSPSDDLPKQPNVDVFQFDQMKERIFEQLESYSGIPFTVQRLCELLVQPKRHYKRTDKFMRGLEKIMLVVSTIDPNPSSEEAESEPPELARTDTISVNSDSESEFLARQEAARDSMESPSKRPRLAEEPGPCDSADEAVLNIQAGAAEVRSLRMVLTLVKKLSVYYFKQNLINSFLTFRRSRCPTLTLLAEVLPTPTEWRRPTLPRPRPGWGAPWSRRRRRTGPAGRRTWTSTPSVPAVRPD